MTQNILIQLDLRRMKKTTYLFISAILTLLLASCSGTMDTTANHENQNHTSNNTSSIEFIGSFEPEHVIDEDSAPIDIDLNNIAKIADNYIGNLIYTVASSDLSVLAVGVVNNMLIIEPQADQNGTVTVNVTFKTASESVDKQFLVTITPQADNPVFVTTALTHALNDAENNVEYIYNGIATDVDGDKVTVSLADDHDWLTLTDKGDGTFILNGTFILSGDPEINSNYDITLTATSGIEGEIDAIQTFTITVRDWATYFNDPLSEFQWHLLNMGTDISYPIYSTAGLSIDNITAGADINVEGAYTKHGITGAGINIAIIDDGLEIAHEDLADNILRDEYGTSLSHNFYNDCLCDDPTLPTTYTGGGHGTSVAGIAAAVANNDVGGIGVAYGAKLIGLNYLQTQTQSNLYLLQSLGSDEEFDKGRRADVINQSYGLDGDQPFSIGEILDVEGAMKIGVTELANGLGAFYTKAAGNGFIETYSGAEILNCDVVYGEYRDITPINASPCQDANTDAYNTIFYNNVIAALNAKGEPASYSSAGSSVLFSAPSGEFGEFAPAIVTTDRSSCGLGYNREGVHPEDSEDFANPSVMTDNDPNCNYTHVFNGTSAATPIASGVAALVMEANSELSWRDVRHILIKTATTNADDRSAELFLKEYSTSDNQLKNQLDDSNNPITYNIVQGWVTNDAGYMHDTSYGFGALNATAAVELAKSYPSFADDLDGSGSDDGNPGLDFYLPSLIKTNSISSGYINVGIPDSSAAGVYHTIDVTGNTYIENLTIEGVLISVTIDHEYIGDIAVELTSPSGTRSIMLHAANSFTSSIQFIDTPLISYAFYGEKVINSDNGENNGEWTIKIIDPVLGGIGTFNRWSIKFYGH